MLTILILLIQEHGISSHLFVSSYEMVGWHYQLNGDEFEQTQGDCQGQGSLVWCSPWGCKESDTTERLNQFLSSTSQFSEYRSFVSFQFSSVTQSCPTL